PHDTQLFEQPLIGLTGGVTVREITQPTPFSLVALPGPLAGTPPRVLAKPPDGSWGPWYQTEYETAAPDPKDQVGGDDVAGGGQSAGLLEGPPGPDPVFLGRTTTVQIAATRPIDASATVVPPPPPSEPPDKNGLRY